MSESSVHIKNRLSILILQDGFSFLILNELSTPIAFDYTKEKEAASISGLMKLLKNKINTKMLEDNHIETLEVLYGNPQFSIVPEKYFEESHLPHYIKYNSKLIEGDDFSYDDLPATKAKSVYIPYININNYLFDEFGSFKFNHILTILIEKGILKSKSTAEYISVHLGTGIMYLAAFQNQKLQATNVFEFETAEDFAYYILFTIEELAFDREKLILEFSGNLSDSKNQAATHLLHTFVRNLEFNNKKSPAKYIHQKGFEAHFNLL